MDKHNFFKNIFNACYSVYINVFLNAIKYRAQNMDIVIINNYNRCKQSVF